MKIFASTNGNLRRAEIVRPGKWRKLCMPYLLILPAMIGLVIFYLYPVIYLICLSLYKYNIINAAMSEYIGLQNYIRLFTDPDFHVAVFNTVVYTVAVVAGTGVISMAVAVWLNKGTFVNRLVQAGIFTPHIISAVSIAMVWMFMMDTQQGLFNALLHMVGLPNVPWLTSSNTALLSVIIVSVWGAIGYHTLLLIAALQSIPPNILEAAELDGANGLRLFFRIKLPLISPQLFFILVTMTIGSFKVFDTVQIMTAGGPDNATDTLVYFLYRYRSTRIGYASAAGVILMILIGLLTYFYFKSLSKRIHYQ